MNRAREFTPAQIFAAPAVLAAATLAGLVAALLGDGVHDVIAWLGLAAPVAAIVWALLRRAQR